MKLYSENWVKGNLEIIPSIYWESDLLKYRVVGVPLYDSAEDEPLLHVPETISPFKFDSLDGLETGYSQKMETGDVFGQELDSSNTVKPHNPVQVDAMTMNTEKVEVLASGKSKEQDMQQALHFNVGSGSSSKKKSQHLPKQKKRSSGEKQSNTKTIADLFPSKKAQEEVGKYEEIKNQAAANLNSVYDEIRPAIEKHGRDCQDNVPPSVGTKWVGAHCAKYKADLNFNVSIIKNFLNIAQKGGTGSKTSGSGDSLTL